MNLSSVLLLLSLLGIILALWLQVKSQRAIIIKSKKSRSRNPFRFAPYLKRTETRTH